ncbi:MAG: hypothetical protein IJS09_03160 [Treponema sp.]|nr:hypothetical protein [Treponema sp.]
MNAFTHRAQRSRRHGRRKEPIQISATLKSARLDKNTWMPSTTARSAAAAMDGGKNQFRFQHR